MILHPVPPVDDAQYPNWCPVNVLRYAADAPVVRNFLTPFTRTILNRIVVKLLGINAKL